MAEPKIDSRFHRQFATAGAALAKAMLEIFAGAGQTNSIRSTGTMAKVIRAVEDSTAAAVSECLADIGKATEHPGRQRKAMLAKLEAALAIHLDWAETQAIERFTKMGMDRVITHAQPLLAMARDRHFARIVDFREGWTAPPAKVWRERHPVYFGMGSALSGAILGIASNSIAEGKWPAIIVWALGWGNA